MDRKSFAFDKTNFTLLGIGMVVIILGFLLMTRSGIDRICIQSGHLQRTPHQGCSGSMLPGIHFHDLRNFA